MINAVIFDLDGLILDTEKLLVKFWREAAAEYGFEMTEEQALFIRSLSGKFAVPHFRKWFGDKFDYNTVRSRRMELMNAYIDEHGLEVKKGIRELLDYLEDRNIPTAVATATDYKRCEDYLKRTWLFKRFNKIICAPMVEFGKPMPDIYIYAAQELELAPCRCMALEDSPCGVLSACYAGCVTVMIPDLTPPDHVSEQITYAVAESAEKVIPIIENYKEGGEETCWLTKL